MNYSSYLQMQDRYYEADVPPDDVVGNFAWHENFPYETFLLHRNGDIRFPVLQDFHSKVALDFACGPGRMIARMSKLFRRVDGVDISSRLLAEAKRRAPQSNFYHSSGDDIGAVPRGAYDFVYSTIAMQHIACHDVRLRILERLAEVLAPGGAITIQMAFRPDFPFTARREYQVMNYRLQIAKKVTSCASWLENRVNAATTNGGCDVGIGANDLDTVLSEFGSLFASVTCWFYDVSLVYSNLGGVSHESGYWPTHWIFINGCKL